MLKGNENFLPARYWLQLPEGPIRCDLCPRHCILAEGQHGFCQIRMRHRDRLVLDLAGSPQAVAVDPIEKKPLYHFYPGTEVFSFGTSGCNLNCRHCQNAHLSRATVPPSASFDRRSASIAPESLALRAVQSGCIGVAYTYNDPVVFLEYAVAAAALVHQHRLYNIAVTAGYILAEPATELFGAMDAVNIDLKCFSEANYKRLCAGHLQPVLDTLRYVLHKTGCWLEITTLLIPGINDSDTEIGQLVEWIGGELGAEIPLHFSAFHPAWRMRTTAPTPPATLYRARQIAFSAGLRHVYLGNLADEPNNDTVCVGCGGILISRRRYTHRLAGLLENGCCRHCGYRLAGRFR